MKITLSDIGKRFNRQWIFRNINLQIQPGDTYALTGNNGSGKSTLLQIIFGFQTYTKGSVTYELNGKVMNEEELIHKIAFTAPYLELPEDFTLKEMLHFHFSLVKLSDGVNMESVLDDCGLKGNENKYIRNFSSGMKQRLKLILAVYSDTPALLLDEPTSNLDENGINWYRRIMKDHIGKKTILIASNQLNEYDFCSHILHVNDFKPTEGNGPVK